MIINNGKHQDDKNRLIAGISGQPFPVIGMSYIKLTLNNFEIAHNFTVCDNSLSLDADELLGSQFFTKYRAIINYGCNEICIGPEVVMISAINCSNREISSINSVLETTNAAANETDDKERRNDTKTTQDKCKVGDRMCSSEIALQSQEVIFCFPECGLQSFEDVVTS